MDKAQELVTRIRRDLAAVEGRLFSHPWVAAAEAGTLTREDLLRFAGQQARIIQSDLRSVALLVHRYGATASGRFFAESLKTEAAALEALYAFASALGADAEALAATSPLAGAQAYTHFVAWLAAYGADAEFAAAFLVNLPAWGKNCGRLARAFRNRYGMADATVAFFDLFAGESPGFAEGALAVIQAGLDRGVPAAAIRDAAELLQQYELMYWDALQAASAVAPPTAGEGRGGGSGSG
jgi:thiaminase